MNLARDLLAAAVLLLYVALDLRRVSLRAPDPWLEKADAVPVLLRELRDLCEFALLFLDVPSWTVCGPGPTTGPQPR